MAVVSWLGEGLINMAPMDLFVLYDSIVAYPIINNKLFNGRQSKPSRIGRVRGKYYHKYAGTQCKQSPKKKTPIKSLGN